MCDFWWKLWKLMAAHVEVIGHRISRFCSREAEEHFYVVGFISRKLDLQRSERGGTTCLRDQRHGCETATVVPWELCEAVESKSVGKQWHYSGSVLCTWKTSLLRKDNCLMPRTKFSFDTMLNILTTWCVIPCCICYSGCGKGSIE